MQKGDFNLNKTRAGIVRKLLWAAASLSLAAGMVALSGCSDNNTSTPDSNSGNPKPSIPTKQITAVLDDMKKGNNYSYVETTEEGEISYLFDGQNMKKIEDGKGVIYTTKFGDPCNLIYNESDRFWHKEETAAINFDAIIYDELAGASWTAYSNGVFTGTMAGETVQLSIVKGVVTIDGEKTDGKIYDINETSNFYPSADKIYGEEQIEKTGKELKTFIANMAVANNYTFKVDENGTQTSYLIADGRMQTLVGEDKNGVIYQTDGDGKAYNYTYAAQNGLWVKEETEKINLNDIILHALVSVNDWKYNASNDSFVATLNGRAVFAKVQNGVLKLEYVDHSAEIFNVATTTVKTLTAEEIEEDAPVTENVA